MDFAGPFFILAIVAMSFLAWIVTTAIRARHGYPIENEWGGMVTRDGDAEIKRLNAELQQENRLLRGKVDRLEERLQVLERIATDAPARLSATIETLR